MSDFSKNYENLQRQAFRKAVHRIWGMIQAGLMDEMTEPEYRIAAILLAHPEYEDVYEDTEILDGREFDTGSEGNPFLHVSFHQMIEDQLASGNHKELSFFVEVMENKGYDRHEIIHAVIKILIRMLSDAINNNKSIDVNRYKRLLTRFGNIELDEVPDALDREFLGH